MKPHRRRKTRWNLKNRRESRQGLAKARQEAWAAKPLEAQIVALNDMLGEGVGATRQRARIAALIVVRDAPPPELQEKPPAKRQRRQRRQEKK